VGNALGLLAFSFDFADLGSDFVAEIKWIRHRIGRDLVWEPLTRSVLGRYKNQWQK
jgi:hypothetical protein